jgi:nucleotide-binding universal stress UspA family protein
MNMSTDKVKKVVIAIDYNPTAQKVAEVGFSIAKAMNAEIILLHVISDFVYYSSTEYSPIMGFDGFLDLSQMQLESTDGLKQAALNFLDKTRQHLGDNSIKTLVKEGDFADSIMKSAKELHADIIILGSHSRKWLENILMGSVTEKVLRHTTIPLFIIPTKRQD